MRKIYILPNLFTAGSLFCGMLAIFEIFKGDIVQACWLILLSAILDVSDGAIARLTKSTSSFGLHLDSLSDLVAFGVAPALMAYHTFGEIYPRIVPTVCSLYTVCGALRLARFNVQAVREERKSFTGLPIPGAALAVISMIWVLAANLQDRQTLQWVGPFAMVLIAYLMVSKVSYSGFKQINLAGRQPFEVLFAFIVIVLLLYMLKQHLDVVLAVCSWTYVLVGLGGHLLRLGRPRRMQEPIEQVAATAGLHSDHRTVRDE